jgi:hypothetical protein
MTGAPVSDSHIVFATLKGEHATTMAHRRTGGVSPGDHPRDGKKTIFRNDKDREDFQDRLGGLLQTCAFLGKELGISPSAVSKSTVRGRRWLEDRDLKQGIVKSP